MADSQQQQQVPQAEERAGVDSIVEEFLGQVQLQEPVAEVALVVLAAIPQSPVVVAAMEFAPPVPGEEKVKELPPRTCRALVFLVALESIAVVHRSAAVATPREEPLLH